MRGTVIAYVAIAVFMLPGNLADAGDCVCSEGAQPNQKMCSDCCTTSTHCDYHGMICRCEVPSPPSAYTQIGSNQYCSNTPRYSDGPGATASDAECRPVCDTDGQCKYYAWWSNHRCYTWDSCELATNPFPGSTVNLWQRSNMTALSV